MPNLKEYIKEKAFVSDRISTQVRIIAIGLLATSWSLLIGQINISKDILQCSRVHFILIIILSILTLVFDFLQYTFSYSNIYKKITKMKILMMKIMMKIYTISLVFSVSKANNLLS